MKNENNPNDNLEGVKKTRNEAARLLAKLESASNIAEAQKGGESANSENTRIDSTNTPNQPNKYASHLPNKGQDNKGNNWIIALLAPLILIVIMVTAAVVGQQQQNISQNKSKTKTTEEVRTTMNTNELAYYQKTLREARQAILKREHEAAIKKLEILKESGYRKYRDADLGLVNNLIIQARKKIKYLDQPGKFKYTETSGYGYQWFDEMPSNRFKVFFAHSRNCKKPIVIFGFMRRSKGEVIQEYKARPSSYLSTILIPMQLEGQQWINVENVQCN